MEVEPDDQNIGSLEQRKMTSCRGPSSSCSGATIKLLDSHTSSLIRKGQVITKISDVVRELVENSVDAEATRVEVYLVKHGLEKIEVRDNGHGIVPEEVQFAAKGGHTSRLEDTSNLSRGKCFGFRGEALNAICSAGKVTVVTKTENNPRALKYPLDSFGNITSESYAAINTGTVVTVEKLFANYPVRRQYYQNNKTISNELKDIETYLKAVAIGNPTCYLGLYHDSNQLWTKAAVPTMKQALMAVLGHNIAKKLVQYGPVQVSLPTDDEDDTVERKIEMFLPTKPVDMRTMSFTSNKMAMIFCNRKRVYIREYEKLIHQFVTTVVEKPQPADQRRFPVSVLSITVPPNEADFNLDVDKTKVFLVHKDVIGTAIEEGLSRFYGITIDDVEKAKRLRNNNDSVPDDPPVSKDPENNSKKKNNAVVVNAPIRTSPAKSSSSTRNNAIKSFMQDNPSVSTGFIRSPSKPANSEPVAVVFPKPVVEAAACKDPFRKPVTTSATISNFQISIDLDSQLTQPELFNNQQPKVSEKTVTNNEKAPSTPVPRSYAVNPIDINIHDWAEGRMRNKQGEIIQNVAILNQPPPPKTRDYEPNPDRSMIVGNPIRCSGTPFSHEPPHKRARADTTPVSHSSFFPPVSPSPRFTRPFHPSTPSPRPSHRQVTLDGLNNWKTPANRFSQSASNAVSGVRLPLTPVSRPITKQCTGQRNNGTSPEEIAIQTAQLWELQQKQQGCIPTPSPPPSVQPPDSVPGSARMPTGRIDWKPVTTFLSSPFPELVPTVHQKLPSSSNECPLYVAQTAKSIGIFSPSNMIHYFSSEIRENPRLENLVSVPNDYSSLSDNQVSSLFEVFTSRPEMYEAPEAAKVFHVMHADVVVTMYNSMSTFHRS